MGINTGELAEYLKPDTNGFIYSSAKSFLNRHANPESLFAQLKSLLFQGELTSCHDLIQLILREGHPLSSYPEVYLLRAQIAFEQGENLGEVMSWVQQARLCDISSNDLLYWDQMMNGILCLKEGDYLRGEEILSSLFGEESVSTIARYSLANHYFWKSRDDKMALSILEELTHERPSFILAKSCLGFLYNKLGMKEKAQIAFAYCLRFETNPEKIKLFKEQLAS
jgi:tetratricopeptide (TPR) repeat protein